MDLHRTLDDSIEKAVILKFHEERDAVEKLVKSIKERESTLRMILRFEKQID